MVAPGSTLNAKKEELMRIVLITFPNCEGKHEENNEGKGGKDQELVSKYEGKYCR